MKNELIILILFNNKKKKKDSEYDGNFCQQTSHACNDNNIALVATRVLCSLFSNKDFCHFMSFKKVPLLHSGAALRFEKCIFYFRKMKFNQYYDAIKIFSHLWMD